MNDITIVIISYNSSAILQQCMDSLLDSGQFRIIIVDNNSSDNSAEILRTRYPKTEIIALNQNIGYGRAANRALEKVSTPYALLLNPDLNVTPAEIDAFLLEVRKSNRKAAVFAPAVKSADFLRTGMIEKEWVIGAAMLFDMELLRPIGFFDENIFLFYEEKDLCKRIRMAGHSILLCSNIYLNHLKGKCCETSHEISHLKNWHVGWSSMYFLTKHNLLKKKHRPWRILFRHRLKSKLSFNPDKRIKFRTRREGILAHQRGQKAFREDGTPQQGI